MEKNPLLTAALEYWKRDWSIIPVNIVKKINIKEGKIEYNKKPPIPTWKEYQDKLPTREEIIEWWGKKYPEAGIALITGKLSGLIVVDVDEEEGEEYLKEKGVPLTPAVKTFRGRHLYFKWPGYPVSNFVKKHGLDLRGDGGFVVLPPTPDPRGGAYKWTIGLEETEIAEPPDWLISLIKEKKKGKKLKESELTKLLAGIKKGRRHDTATRLAGYFLGKKLDSGVVLIQLQDWNKKNKPPLPKAEIERIINDFVAPPQEKVSEAKSLRPYPRPVFERNEMYQKNKMTNEGPVPYPITNFLIIPKERIEIEGKEFLKAKVKTCQGIVHPNIQFGPESWISKPKFKNALSFLDVEFTGSDADIQSVGGIVAGKNAPQKQGVMRTGLHYIKKKWVYVEEELAWDAKGQRNDIVYLADDPYKVNLLDQPDLSSSELDEILSCIFSWNENDVVYPLTGWGFACFVKERIFLLSRQNPMLICWGEKGSGKSATLAVLLQRLFGIRIGTEDISVPTEFSFAKVICSSSLAPVLYDEYKIGKIDLKQRKIISSTMTSVFNQRDFTRGKVTLGLVRWTYSAPVVVAGEMKTSELAIQDRIVETYFSKKKIESAGRTEAFEKLGKLPLGALGKSFLTWTLKLEKNEIKDLWQMQLENVDKELTGRLRQNTAHAKMGLALFFQYLESRGKKVIHLDAFDIIDEAQKKNILEQSNKTEVDTIIEAFSVMAGTRIGGSYILEKDIHYKVDSKLKLYLHVPSVYPLFRKWAKDTDWEHERLDQNAFTKQLRDMKYFKDYTSARFDIVKTVFILDLAKMRHLLVEEFSEASLEAMPEEDWGEREEANGE